MTQQRPEPADDLTAMEIADAMWLASVVSRRGGALDHPAADQRPPEEPPSSRDSEPAPPADHVSPARGGQPDSEPEGRRPGHTTPTAGSPGEPAAASALLPRQRPSVHTKMPPPSEPALGGRSIGAPALTEPLALARALRPLRTHTAESRHTQFDEAATARRAVEDDFWLPVFRPARSRPWHEATLIIDDGPTMGLWHRTGTELAELLARIDAFGSVRTLRLDTTTPTDGRPPMLRNRAREVSPRSLGTPGRRSIVLALTDGIGTAWRAGTAQALLRDLARTHTTAVVHLLPERAWAWTGIQVRPVLLHRAAPGPGNAGLATLRQPVEAFDDLAFDGEGLDAEAWSDPLVPVLKLHPEFLVRWSRLAAGRRTSEPLKLPVMLTSALNGGSQPLAAVRAATQSAKATVSQARSRLSPTAFHGAVHLAALPLSEAVVRGLPPLLDPDFQQEHLGELLASKLLRMEPDDAAGSRSANFTFDPGVREELLSYGSRADTYRTVRLAHPFITDRTQREVLTHQLRLFRGEDTTPPVVTDDNRPYVTLSRAVLRATSGPLLTPAEESPTRLAASPPAERAVPDHSAEPQPVSQPAVALSTDTPPSADRSHRPTSIWYGLPPRNRHFSGRERELATLGGRLIPDSPMTTVEALLGMGGVGKTQLAIEYVYRHSHAYDVICWIPSEPPTRIVAAFQQIAHLLGITLPPDAPAHDAVPAVLETLRTGDLWQRWLLIFDNAEAVQDVQPFFPLSGPGRVLVTSRNTQWAHVARALKVDVFSRQESCELLRRRDEHISPTRADQLADALGDLPLALEQASVWLLDTGMPAEEYIRLFQEKVTEMLTVNTPPRYEVPVAAAWNVALARLREDEPLALRILQVCSQLCPGPVPRSMFVAPGGGHSTTDTLPATDPIRLGRAIRALNRHSLARIDHRADSIQIHRLLSAVLNHAMTAAERADVRRTAWQLLAAQPPGAHLTDHLIASGAATATEAGIQSAVRAQLDWLASHGFTEDEQRLYREAYGIEGTGTSAHRGR